MNALCSRIAFGCVYACLSQQWQLDEKANSPSIHQYTINHVVIWPILCMCICLQRHFYCICSLVSLIYWDSSEEYHNLVGFFLSLRQCNSCFYTVNIDTKKGIVFGSFWHCRTISVKTLFSTSAECVGCSAFEFMCIIENFPRDSGKRKKISERSHIQTRKNVA